MGTKQLFASLLAASLISCGGASTAFAAAMDAKNSIGVAGAVSGLVRAIPPSSPKSIGRVIESGKPLFIKEHVTTGPGGRLQIMLKDETVFTIGPNTDIVLDEFVYNPETDAGKVSASVSKGVFRFITGNIGHKDPSSMQVKLPAGTIGIRGTIVAGQVNGNGTSMVVLLGPGPSATGARVGAFELSNAAGSVSVEKPGYGSTLAGAGVAPTPPALVPADQMKALLGSLVTATDAQAGSKDDGSDPHGLIGGAPKDSKGSSDSSDSSGAYGGIGDYSSSGEVFSNSGAQTAGIITSVGDGQGGGLGGIQAGPGKWEDITDNIVKGSGVFPARSGAVVLTNCGAGACSNPNGTWGFSATTIDFAAQTISGTAYLTATPGGAFSSINDSIPFSVSFAGKSGDAKFPVGDSTVNSRFNFELLNGAADPGRTLVGDAVYQDTTNNVNGSGAMLSSTRP